ncbi:MAG: amidohydrolase [Armatimonadetes bacterium]|nr:amidohydrolase [Armatimonadota bacterium]
MTIDTNCHLGHWPFRKLAHADADGLLSLMDRYGVEQAWVGAFEGVFYRDCGQANRDLLKRIAGHEDRLVPWATINPNFPAWEDDLREAMEAGMVGVRLYPNYHGYALDAPCLSELLACLQNRLPVAVYHKFLDERLHHWTCLVPPVDMDLAPLVGAFPQQRFLLCGCGMPRAQALAEIIRRGHVYMEISRLEGVEGVRLLIDTIGLERVVLGSHAPYFTMAAAHLKLVESGLSDAERAHILQENPARLLGRG